MLPGVAHGAGEHTQPYETCSSVGGGGSTLISTCSLSPTNRLQPLIVGCHACKAQHTGRDELLGVGMAGCSTLDDSGGAPARVDVAR